MAKKKSSAKQTKKASSKKVVKKTAPKKKTAKKISAKAATKKKTPAKVAAPKKKTVAKKAVAKKISTVASKPQPMKSAKKLDLTHFVTPLDDRLIVRLSGMERMTPGGLYIPDTVSDTSGNLQGVVVAVGRGHFNKKGHLRPMDVQLGDQVVFAQYSGSKIKIQDEDLVILRESDVMGVVSK